MNHKLNARFYFCLAALGVVFALIAKVIIMLINNQVETEDGPMSTPLRAVLISGIIIISLSWVISFLNMIKSAIKNKGKAFTFTEDGIENGMCSAIILAFIFVGHIKFIPWSVLSDIHNENGILIAKVDTSQVDASPVTKILLKVYGYKFGANFVSPIVTEDDIAIYKNR